MLATTPLRIHDPDAPAHRLAAHLDFKSLKHSAATNRDVSDRQFKVLDAIGELNGDYGDELPADAIGHRSGVPTRTVYTAVDHLASLGYLTTAKNAGGKYTRIQINTVDLAQYRAECRREIEKDPRCMARRARSDPEPAPPAAQPVPVIAPLAAQQTMTSAPRAAPTPAPAPPAASRAHASGSKLSYGYGTELNPSPVTPEITATVDSLSPSERSQVERDALRRDGAGLIARRLLQLMDDPTPAETPRMESFTPSSSQGMPRESKIAEDVADGFLARFQGRPPNEAAWSIAESLGARWGESNPGWIRYWAEWMPLIPRPALRQLLVDVFKRTTQNKAHFFSKGITTARKKPAPGPTPQMSPGAGEHRHPVPMSNSTQEVNL